MYPRKTKVAVGIVVTLGVLGAILTFLGLSFSCSMGTLVNGVGSHACTDAWVFPLVILAATGGLVAFIRAGRRLPEDDE